MKFTIGVKFTINLKFTNVVKFTINGKFTIDVAFSLNVKFTKKVIFFITYMILFSFINFNVKSFVLYVLFYVAECTVRGDVFTVESLYCVLER